MTTALEQNREDQALGAAWRRCEAALPDWYLASVTLYVSGWEAIARCRPRYGIYAKSGATPIEALTALAEALEAR